MKSCIYCGRHHQHMTDEACRFFQTLNLSRATAPDPPPSLVAAVRAARTGSDAQSDQLRVAALTVLAGGERPVSPAPLRPSVALAAVEPPSLVEAIRAARAKEVR